MRQYLKDLIPVEVTERLNNGETVHYQDSKGVWHTYGFVNGICVRYTNGKVDGYGRSIYSTGEAFFETKEEKELILIPGERYRTRDGRIAITTTSDTDSVWIEGYILDENMETRRASWNKNGLFYGEGTVDPRDIVEELV